MSDKSSPNANKGIGSNFLPKFFQSDSNKKFLASTIDQLVQPGTVKKVTGYIGRKNSKSSTGNDVFIAGTTPARENYQLEPSLVISDKFNQTTVYKDYQDYINQLDIFGGNTKNHERINRQEFYSWDPHINWDMFVNFRQYYWLPYGPEPIKIYGQQQSINSTYTVTVEEVLDNKDYIFTPDGVTRAPILQLYRGQTYTFEIDSPNEPFSIKVARTPGEFDRYLDNNAVSAFAVEAGTITLRIPEDAPNLLYYVSENNIDLGGAFVISDITENTIFDVEAEIIGKRNYTLDGGTELTNGMKLCFGGKASPESYRTGYYYVSGVGKAIKLIPSSVLEVPSTYSQELAMPFDFSPFEEFPFAAASALASQPDYVVIERSSQDQNPWSRYNRWFHADTIKSSAEYNGHTAILDQIRRANRPIIEFEPGLQLFNFGRHALEPITLVDTITTDIFSTVEGQVGYFIDGVELEDGMRVLFTQETDILAKNKIYQVRILTEDYPERQIQRYQVHLEPIDDPEEGDVVLVTHGRSEQSNMFWFDGSSWNRAQTKTEFNQAPLFDVFDSGGISYGDTSAYRGSTFAGTRLFSYKEAAGKNDPVLGFPLTYKNINNIGDIVFDFNLATDTFNYRDISTVKTVSIEPGYLLKHLDTKDVYVTGWQQSLVENYQPAIRIYKNSGKVNNFLLDIYDNITDLLDLTVRVYVNGKMLDKDSWTLNDSAVYKVLTLDTNISESDVLTIKSFAAQPINDNGYYEVPINLQNNPLNQTIDTFTLGEVVEHFNSIVENIQDVFVGDPHGLNNTRDIDNITPYGTKFVQHTSPFSLPLYHVTSEVNNIVKSVEHSQNNYGIFKRNFVTLMDTVGVDDDIIASVDAILVAINKDIPASAPYYYSDMVGYGPSVKNSHRILDNRTTLYPLTQSFNLSELSTKAVNIYLNDDQLIHGSDYTFNFAGFVEVTATLSVGDTLTIYEYESSNGCFIPPTPTKLGIWPKYEPKIYIDDTYLTPKTIILGHDGSKILAYGDYRDNLILELEKRIYNNIKVEYDPTVFDIHDIVPGYYRSNDYSLSEFNNALAPHFYKWMKLVDRDFSKPMSFDKTNPFTYNYRGNESPDGREVPGYWRGIYRWLLDTDSPHTRPWEMLGFTIKPVWWEDEYGPAPYTSNNTILWNDISAGIIREPGTPGIVNNKYARPYIIGKLPVDADGNLISPMDSNLAQGLIKQSSGTGYIFGDVSPVENAWRNSSYYPFAVLQTAMILKPAATIGVLFDRSRTARNLAGQVVYSKTNLPIRPKDLLVPSLRDSDSLVLTAGLINYVVDFICSKNKNYYPEYQTDLLNATFKLAYRVAGFTSKEKFSLLLDSKNPASTGGVFVPPENYVVSLNSSTPVKKLSYSGIMITKLSDGYEVKGYSQTQPFFKYYTWIQSGPSVNVGGISESYTPWTPGKLYITGQNVVYENRYYKATTNSQNSTFDNSAFIRLVSLPVTGGRDAEFRKVWDRSEELVLPYGTKFETVQETVDFLLGHGEYLKDQGFVFDDFSSNMGAVTNWETSAKEFMFWSTQNWSSGEEKWSDWIPETEYNFGSIVKYNGDYWKAIRNIPASTDFEEQYYDKLDGLSLVGNSVISLSPAANRLMFTVESTVVDDIGNPFNDYEIFKVDGTPITHDQLESFREENIVTYTPRTSDGIFCATFYLIQKEQVVIIDNTTIFNDTIYNPATGYRQERIKASGYVSTNWDGSFNAPGFIFDNAQIKDWSAWKDYALGDIVLYKTKYYTSLEFQLGTEVFDDTKWSKLDTLPKPQLLPNWTYKAGQFTDFYSLDSDNFDDTQQLLAQHLIGYQKRPYLSNIIQNDVSEYKFYQGMIVEKGTQNSLNKLFDVLSAAGTDSLDFYEEWAIRTGRYGASEAFETFEIVLDESLIKANPQGYQLVETEDTTSNDFIIRPTPADIYVKPSDYVSEPWPQNLNYKPYLRTPGYVRTSEVAKVVSTLSDLIGTTTVGFKNGDYIWAGFETPSWNVYRYTASKWTITNVTYDSDAKELTIVTDALIDMSLEGTYIGITNVSFNQFYKIKEIKLGSIVVDANIPGWVNPFTGQASILVFLLTSQRASSIDTAGDILPKVVKDGELLWTDNDGNNKWATWIYEPVYNRSSISQPAITQDLGFGKSIVCNREATKMAVYSSQGIVIYKKSDSVWTTVQTVTPTFSTTGNANEIFGETLGFSVDGTWLFVGSPRATATYNYEGEIAVYKLDNTGTYNLINYLNAYLPLVGKQFSSSIVCRDDTLIVGARGANNKRGSVEIFKLSNDLWSYNQTLVEDVVAGSDYGTNVRTSDDLSIVAISAPGSNPGQVFIYKLVSGQYVLDQTITGNDINFSIGLSMSPSGSYLAVGSTWYNGDKIDQGKVEVYMSTNTGYVIHQTLFSPTPETSENFGRRVGFMNDDETIVVYSENGVSFEITRVDSSETTFDSNVLRLIDSATDGGRIDIFDKYANNWIYSESLSTANQVGSNYGRGLAVGNDTIIVGDPQYTVDSVTGVGYLYIYEKTSGTLSWSILHSEVSKPDLSKIKSVFLYNKVKNTLVTYLDIVDPVQGKIPGAAEEELRYKTFYDPAIYTNGNGTVNVDEGQAWDVNQVGQLWWDLRTTKFIDNYDVNEVYRNAVLNTLYPTASVDVYEWVESSLLPSSWDTLADTEAGLTSGISGTSLYGDAVYSIKRRYDTVSETFKNTYYFWVKNKQIIPNFVNRNLSAASVSNLISNPRGQDYQYITFTGTDSFSLVNVAPLLKDTDIVLAVEYWVTDKVDQNIHYQWNIISNDRSCTIPRNIERKWVDSLCGKDEQGRLVPDEDLPVRLKYGVENNPRQSMFINKFEATKELIEHANRVLIQHQVVLEKDISSLQSYEPEPGPATGLYDIVIDTTAELRFVNIVMARAQIEPVIVNGTITGITIVNAGVGYVNAPFVSIDGAGVGAEIRTVLGNQGQVIDAIIINGGKGYKDDTTLTVRPISVLVHSDSESENVWAIYGYNLNVWERTSLQSFDIRKYWSYSDWYSSSVDPTLEPSYVINTVSDLYSISPNIGDIVKIRTTGTGGWQWLRKYANSSSYDWTRSYEVVATNGGTLQFSSSLYKFINSEIGYDGTLYDTVQYDNVPTLELRKILEALKTDIFINDLKSEYLNLFFVTLKYAHSEQHYLDWVFKTSFVKAKHLAGSLRQTTVYTNDNLPDFEKYVEEVKPYKTKVREYISNYSTVDANSMMFTDFDLPPVYSDNRTDVIKTYVVDGEISVTDPAVQLNPWNNWYNNVGFKITEIIITDGGSGYYEPPTVSIESTSGEGAVARAFITNGVVVRIVILSQGTGYLSAPTITFSGEQTPEGTPAKAIAIIGDSLVRSNLIKMKFDRITRTYSYTQLNQSASFIGNGSKRQFSLIWPADIKVGKVNITVNGIAALRDSYTVVTVKSTAKGYTTYNSLVTFINAPADQAVIQVEYLLDISLLSAADRVTYFYNPETGQYGNELSQVMTGIDYGGVNVTGLNFNTRSGWGSDGYYTDRWDVFDETFDDFYIIANADDHEFTLPYTPEEGTEINVYYSAVNHDVYSGDDVTVDYIVSENFRNYSVTCEQDSSVTSVVATGSIIITVSTSDNISIGDVLTSPLAENPFQDNTTVTAINGTTITINRSTVNIIPAGTTITFTNQLEELTDYDVVGDGGGHIIVRLKQAATTGTTLRINYLTDHIRIDDPDFGNSPANDNALMETIVADGTTAVVQIPLTITINAGDELIFRKSTSDGSMKPNEADYDTALTGGDMEYQTALGIDPADIIVDGDDFVTPTSSPFPEEVVPGQIVDSVAIKFYGSASSQSARVKIDTYISAGDTASFALSQVLNSQQAIIVTVDNQILDEADYQVNYQTNTVEITYVPTVGSVVALYNFGMGGENVLDYGSFTLSEPLDEFVTNSKWYNDFVAVVYQNGSVIEPEFFATDDTYNAPDRIGIRFDPIPATGDVITYFIVSGTEKTFTTCSKEVVVTNGVDYTYDLTNEIGTNKPYDSYVIVRNGSTILRPSNNFYFTVKDNQVEYSLPTDLIAPYSVLPTEIKVFVGSTELVQSTDYSVDVSAVSISLTNNAYSLYETSQLVISVTTNAEFSCTNNTITFVELYPDGTQIEVMSSYNHNVYKTQSSDVSVSVSGSLTPDTVEYYNYTSLTGGKVKLPKFIVEEDSLFVIKNNIMQVPSFDYKLNDDRTSITFNTELAVNDVISLMIYASPSGIQPRIGFMQFKDMLNRVHYKRLNANKLTVLASPLYYTDTTIEVEDGSVLSLPLPEHNQPGVIYVAGERIEYFTKDGNILGQLRRATLGTGAPYVHAANNWVQDIGTAETIPYKEAPIITQLKVDGTSKVIDLPYVPAKSNDTWSFVDGFETSIPVDYGQSNDIEVFVGGYDDENSWLPEKEYVVGDLITIGVYSYKCITSHVSGSIFDSTYWIMFIGNIRLRKAPFAVFNANIDQGSSEGDVQFDADFSVDGTSAQVRLTNDLSPNTRVTVVKRTSGFFPTSDDDLYYNNNAISKFLNAAPGSPFTNFVKYDEGLLRFDSTTVTFDNDQVTFDRR